MSTKDELPEDIDYPEYYWRYKDLKPNSRRDSKRAIERLQKFLHEDHSDTEIDEVTPLLIKEFVDKKLRSEHRLTDDAINNTLGYLSSFYGFYAQMGEMGNPVPIARDTHLKLELNRAGRQWPEVTLAKMQELIDSINTPQMKAITLTLLKTGVRASELCNFDLRDLHLDHEGYRQAYFKDECHNAALRKEIKYRPDSLYIDSKITEGEVHNGEERENSNKRNTSTIIPVDDDLKKALLHWLACRRDTPDLSANPLFLSPGKILPQRFERSALKNRLKRKTEQAGQQLPPHFFRSYFVTMHRPSPDISEEKQPHQGAFPDPQMRYLRGDSMGKDMLEQYTQQWSLRVKETYIENVYKFEVSY